MSQSVRSGLPQTFHQTFNHQIKRAVQVLQKFVGRLWYPPATGLLAALDNFFLVIPMDGILISSTMLTPRRWLALAMSVAIGSTIGAMILSGFVEAKGLPWILEMYPGINESNWWIWTADFFQSYGLLVVFAVAVTPFVQQPAVILASMAKTPMLELALVIFLGRTIKYLIMAYVASHAPRLLSKMWGLRDELEAVDIKASSAS